jgi:hypothetical protein
MRTSNLIADGAPAPLEAASHLPPPPTRLPRPALFLDMDGVLAPLEYRRNAAIPAAILSFGDDYSDSLDIELAMKGAGRPL